ncbi:MAG: flippase [bacterium]
MSILAKNTSLFTASLVIQKALAFVFFTYLSRKIGATGTGDYLFALSFATIFGFLIDWGWSSVMTREVASRTGEEDNGRISLPDLYRQLFTWRLVMSLAVLAVINLLAWQFGYPLMRRQMVAIAAFITVFDSFSLYGYAIFRGKHNLRYESYFTAAYHAIVLTVGSILLLYTKDLRLLLLALLTASFFNALYVAVLLVRKAGVSLWPENPLAAVKYFWPMGWPFLLNGLFIKVYGSIDSILLDHLGSTTQLGYYGVANKVTLALTFIPQALAAAYYPAASAAWSNNRTALAPLFKQSVIYLGAISIPISVLVAFLAQPLITLVYPGFTGSILPLQILISSLFFLFVNFPIGYTLNACHKQRRNTLNLVVIVTMNIILNILLIPLFGAIGAAVSSLATNVLVVLLGWPLAKSLTGSSWMELLWPLGKILCAAIVAGIIALSVPVWWLAGMIGGVIYVLLLFILRVVAVSDLIHWRKAVTGTEV